MRDDLLRWYNTELGFLRRMGEQFAREHPKIAGRLKLGPESSQDPHVERLIEAVAFLNARTRQKIDDDFPELANALLEVLQPQLLAPIPSMLITQMTMADNELDSATGYEVASGTPLETEAIDGEPCRFRTGYPVTMFPVEVSAARCSSRPFTAPVTESSNEATGVIHVTLRTLSDDLTISDLQWSNLRFYLRGLPQLSFSLYEAMFNDVTEVAFARTIDDPSPIVFPGSIIEQVGFNADDVLLPGSSRTAWEYRLLTEFFLFPQKFLFFQLNKLESLRQAGFGKELHLFFYLRKVQSELENNIGADSFALGCTPAINLFKQRADPVYLSQTEYEYPLCGDIRRPDSVEVYSIDDVTAQNNEGEEVIFRPFYTVGHLGDQQQEPEGFWHAVRRDSQMCETDATSGSEMFLSFVDLSFETIQRDDWIVSIETTCLNRDLPEKLPFGQGQPKLSATAEAGGIGSVSAVTAPTPTIRPKLLNHARWRLISHLNIDHLAIVGGDRAADALREILAIYNFEESAAANNLIQSIVQVDSSRVTRRIRDADFSGVCRGVEITVTFDARLSDPKAFLLACVLEQFLSQTCTMNSFSQLIVRVEKEEDAWKTWPPRSGGRTLL